jgi:serine phosphatase RsbU (regulator of sigma subunit)
VPLGLLADVAFDRLVVKPQSGDLMVLYSDGVSEATRLVQMKMNSVGTA